MNKYINVSVLAICFFLLIDNAFSQDIEIVVHRTYIDSTLGSEMVFEFEIINISQAEQTVFEVRTINDLPGDWTSSLCFGVNCFPPSLDSVATTIDFNTPPIIPGDTLITSLHVTAIGNDGTANVQIQIGTFRTPTARTIIDFVATTPEALEDEITVVVHQTNIDSTLGSEMVFDFEVINISQFQQTVFEVRTVNDLPSSWASSLCFGDNCYSSELDSIATTPDFGATPPLNPGDTLITSLHVVSAGSDGTANVQVQVGTFRDPTNRIELNLTATTIPVSVEDENTIVTDYYLEQNYPNPFNPSTKINFGIKKASNVEISVYNILGNKITTLFNGIKSKGNHSVTFDASKFSSGVYFYKIISEDFVQTKKMILEK
jgi:hypothetical protein